MVARHHPDQSPLFKPPVLWTAPSELPSLAGLRRISVDTETCDPSLELLGPGARRGGYIVGLSVGTEDGRSWYFPTRHEGGGNLDEGLVWRWARGELNAFSGIVVGANLLYDLDFLANYGVTFPLVKRFHDIQLAEPLLDEHRLSYSLDSLSKDYLGETKHEEILREAAAIYGFGESNKQVKQNLWRLPAGYVGPYGEGDAELPLRIMDLQLKRLEEENLLELFDLESRLMPVLLAMRRRGVRIDVNRADRVRAQLVKERDVALAEVRRIAGPQAELMAPDSFASALIERNLSVPLTEKTKKPSITKGWLEANVADELVAAIMKGRRVNTIITTFIDGHIKTHSINGRIHCQFNQLKGDDSGTIARLSSSLPNLQNIPSRDEIIGPMIRSLFLPDEGECFKRIDYSQIEYRFLVHYSAGIGANEARQQYVDEPKTDFHKLCAEMLGADPEDKVRRKRVKNTNFCAVYGGGIPKLAATFGCTIQEATEFYELYNEKLPFVKQTFTRAMNAAGQRGWVKTHLGRLQRFPLWEKAGSYSGKENALPRLLAEEKYGFKLQRAFTYAALNRVLQGSAADLMKKAMVDVVESGVCDVIGAPLLTVHDELDLSSPTSHAGEEAVLEIKRIMECAVTLTVPVIAELESGPNWGECK